MRSSLATTLDLGWSLQGPVDWLTVPEDALRLGILWHSWLAMSRDPGRWLDEWRRILADHEQFPPVESPIALRRRFHGSRWDPDAGKRFQELIGAPRLVPLAVALALGGP